MVSDEIEEISYRPIRAPLGSGAGISVFGFEPETGGLTLVQTVTGVANPSFLALDAAQRSLYAVEELDEGGVSAFARDPETGQLTLLNRQASHGAAPCYVGLDGSGRYALVANYGSGTVAALPVAADGRLGPATGVVRHEGSGVDPERQTGPHAHMIAPDPTGPIRARHRPGDGPDPGLQARRRDRPPDAERPGTRVRGRRAR